ATRSMKKNAANSDWAKPLLIVLTRRFFIASSWMSIDLTKLTSERESIVQGATILTATLFLSASSLFPALCWGGCGDGRGPVRNSLHGLCRPHLGCRKPAR